MISPIHPNKFPMTENIVNRDELQEAYIESIVDGMDTQTMYQFVYDTLNDNFDKYTVDELITEVEDYYPELLNDNDEDNVPDESTGWN